MTVNTRAIELSGIDAVHDDNIGRYPDRSCNGNVAEPEFMSYVLKAGGMRISGDAAETAEKATVISPSWPNTTAALRSLIRLSALS